MNNKETSQERKERFKAMSSQERTSLIRDKLKAQGLQEGSGIKGEDLTSYNQDEIWDVIQATSCLPDIKAKKPEIKLQPKRKKALVISILTAIAFVSGIFMYYEQYPSAEIRREISIDGMFLD